MEGEKVYHIIFIRSWNNFSANNIQLLQQQNDLMLKYHAPFKKNFDRFMLLHLEETLLALEISV